MIKEMNMQLHGPMGITGIILFWAVALVRLRKAIGKVGIHLNLGFKTRGYVLGKQISEGANLGFGILNYASYLN